jgi:hypothetical protein
MSLSQRGNSRARSAALDLGCVITLRQHLQRNTGCQSSTTFASSSLTAVLPLLREKWSCGPGDKSFCCTHPQTLGDVGLCPTQLDARVSNVAQPTSDRRRRWPSLGVSCYELTIAAGWKSDWSCGSSHHFRTDASAPLEKSCFFAKTKFGGKIPRNGHIAARN